MIKAAVECIRDPFVVIDNGVYYMYGTHRDKVDLTNKLWYCYKNTDGKLDGRWERVNNPLYIVPKNAVKNFWAPEVHKYKGAFYLIGTYFSSETNHRGCSVLKSDSPEGPFVEISDGHVTPELYDCIDGTLYVDENGTPWMIYVREWVATEDKIGRMVAAKMSDDLTRFVSEPRELFRADAPVWATREITDGCFMHKTKDNQLLMIWSNMDKDGYCVGIARSTDGTMEGDWIQDEKLLFSKSLYGDCDGGHGMIFTDTDGQMYLSLHGPNRRTEERSEQAMFIPIHEENGTLVCDFK